KLLSLVVFRQRRPERAEHCRLLSHLVLSLSAFGVLFRHRAVTRVLVKKRSYIIGNLGFAVNLFMLPDEETFKHFGKGILVAGLLGPGHHGVGGLNGIGGVVDGM